MKKSFKYTIINTEDFKEYIEFITSGNYIPMALNDTAYKDAKMIHPCDLYQNDIVQCNR